jgi:hypothetical protein
MRTLKSAKVLAMALGEYSEEQGGRLPLTIAENLQNHAALRVHLPADFAWAYRPETRFIVNKQLLGIPLKNIPQPESRILVFELEPWWDGRRCVGFVDGHSELLILAETDIHRMLQPRNASR